MASLEEKVQQGNLTEEERKAAERLGLVKPNREKLFGEFVGKGAERDLLKEDRRKRDEMTGWLELADRLAQGITKYAAARKGAKEGIDLSKLDIKGTDWDKVRDRAAARYKEDVGDIGRREKEIADVLGKSTADSKMKMATGVQEKGTGLPVYRIEGKTGYFNIDQQPVEVERYQKPDKEIPDVYSTSLKRDPDLLTEDGEPVYKMIITNKRSPEETKVIPSDAFGNPLKKSIKTKVGIDPRAVLSDKEVKDLATSQATLDLLDHLAEAKKAVDTDRVAYYRNIMAGWVGADDPDISAFRSDAQDTLNKYIKEMSGATVPVQEVPRLEAGMPTMKDDDETFMKKLEATKNRLLMFRNNYLKALKAKGKKVEGFEEGVRNTESQVDPELLNAYKKKYPNKSEEELIKAIQKMK